mmetsp:Transcript_26029/g.62700  ORF Transcript_26029/g.62700 Transcript_26029/m.62700 type:complete len:88 (+) Transcript_26029:1085-1348(+)
MKRKGVTVRHQPPMTIGDRRARREENITSTITARGGNVIIIMIIVIGTDTAAKVEGNTNGIIPRVGKLVAAHQAEASAKPRTRLVKS